MPDNILHLGIIGVGMIAVLRHIPALRKTDRARIVALCRRDKAKLALAQEHIGADETYTDWREMLDSAELDAVLVCTPPGLHAEPTVQALERGLHVLVEKPMALGFAEAWAMVEAARRADRVLMGAYNGRFSRTLRTVKEALADGRIGTVRQMSVNQTAYRRFFWTDEPLPEDWRPTMAQWSGLPGAFFADYGRPGDWHTDPVQTGGGTFADNGPHVINPALWLGGAPPAEVMAFSETAGLPVECFVNVQARLANGVLLSFVFGDANPGSMGQTVWRVVGDEGLLTVDREQNIWVERGQAREQLEPEVLDVPPALSFVNCVLDGTPNLSPGEDAAYSAAFVEAAYRSAAEGRIVRLPIPYDGSTSV
jgi:predicted dehydrogenase